jgi:hypothetical protein
VISALLTLLVWPHSFVPGEIERVDGVDWQR